MKALLSERNAQINTLHDIKSVSRQEMDKPAERLTRVKQFRVRVPIGAIFTTTIDYSHYTIFEKNLRTTLYVLVLYMKYEVYMKVYGITDLLNLKQRC